MVRVSSAFVLIATLVASTFAAPAANKRDVGEVVNAFDHITELVTDLYRLIDDDHSDSLYAASYINTKTLKIIEEMKSATVEAQDCSPFSDDEAVRMMDSAYAFAPTVHKLLRTMIAREPYIAALPYKGVKEIVEDNLQQMEDAAIEFQDALKEKAPETFVPHITNLEDEFRVEFEEARRAYA